jgi:hypothetical protein
MFVTETSSAFEIVLQAELDNMYSQDDIEQSPFYALVECRSEVENIVAHTVVPDAVRMECEAELEAGRKRGWKL